VRHRLFAHDLVSVEEKKDILDALAIPWIKTPCHSQLDLLFKELECLWIEVNHNLKQGTLKHLKYNHTKKEVLWVKPRIVNEAAVFYAKALRAKLGDRVLGPVIPNIARIRNYFGQNIMLKLEKSGPVLLGAKALIRHTTEVMLGRPGLSQVQVAVDVDPV
jgi:hypothetical protein